MLPRQLDCDWRTLSRCPVCTALVHLVRDGGLARRPASPLPHARIGYHVNGWGDECYMNHRAAPAWDEPTTRAAVSGRSMGVCEYCSAAPAQEMHHRKARSVGGKWHPANIIHLCCGCHRRCTSPAGPEREWAEYVGLVVHGYEDPAKVPVLRGVITWPIRRVGHHTSEGGGDVLLLTDDVTGGLNDEYRPTARDRRTKRRHA